MANGYNVVLGHAHGRLDESIPLSEVLETRHTDAIILLGDMQDQPRLLADLRASQVPVVALWQGSSPREFPTMDVDDRAGVVTGLEHLVELGHSRIAFVSAALPGNNPVREDAYVAFMRDRFGGVPTGYVQHVPNGWQAARRPCWRSSSCGIRRPRSSRRPISPRSACCTPRTAHTGWFRTSSRWWATTTCRSPPTRSRP